MSGGEGEITPAAAGRSHALQRLVEFAEGLAAAPRGPMDQIPADAREYVQSFNATLRNVAERLRQTRGYQP